MSILLISESIYLLPAEQSQLDQDTTRYIYILLQPMSHN